MGFFIFLHTLVCIALACIILMQSGRGGGLTESFSSMESMFGAKTNVMLIKMTTVLASVFLVTCLTLAILSSQKGRSLMSDRAVAPPTTETTAEETATQAPQADFDEVQPPIAGPKQ